MAESSLTLKVITPNDVYFEGPVVSVVAPGTAGSFGILRNHAPLITTLEKGRLFFRNAEGVTQTLKVDGGFLEVLKNRVMVLTDRVEAVS